MIVTEKEASTIRCQEGYAARITEADYEGGFIYTHQQAGHFTKTSVAPHFCIGSRCMAWNWEGWRATQANGVLPRRLHKQEDKPNLVEGWTSERVGSCGKCG